MFELYGLWGRAFRPFFLCMAAFAMVSTLWWSAGMAGWVATPIWLIGPWWHGHEMIFGFAAAAIAGFLLTAVANWTGKPAVAGTPLAILVLLWLGGRLAMASGLPLTLKAGIDLLFLPGLALVVLHALAGTGQWRNYGIVVVLLVLATCNALMHGQAVLGWNTASLGLSLALDLVIVLLLVISGRIVPSFTANALNRRGISHRIRPWTAAGRGIVFGAVLVGVLSALEMEVLCRATAGITGTAILIRLVAWESHRSLGDPLLWSLHIGVGWIAVGMLLRFAGVFPWMPGGAYVHALTVGAVGGSIVAVATRVSLGHTGRPLEVQTPVTAIYVLVSLAAVLRISWHMGWIPGAYPLLSTICWCAAFLIFLILFTKALLTRRPDGRPG